MSAVVVGAVPVGTLCRFRPEVGLGSLAPDRVDVVVLQQLTGARVRVGYQVGAGPRTELTVPVSVLRLVTPAARSTDPATSHAAAQGAAAPMKLGAGQRRALNAIVLAGETGLNDFELAERVGRKQSSIGVRRGELAGVGLVERTGEQRPSDTGTPSDVWRATELGRSVWQSIPPSERAA